LRYDSFSFREGAADSSGRILLKGDNITLVQPAQA
jgi:hypothetical protein